MPIGDAGNTLNGRKLAAILQVDASGFRREVLQAPSPVLVDFWASDCRPCDLIRPLIEELATDNERHLKVVAVHVNTNEELAHMCGLTSAPTLVIYSGGQERNRVVVQEIVGRVSEGAGDQSAMVERFLREARDAVEAMLSQVAPAPA